MQIRAGPLSLGKGQSIMQMRGCRFRPFQRCNIVETETTNRDGGEGEGGKGKWNRLIINILHSFFRFFFFFFFFFFFISNGKIYRSSATNDPVSSGQCPISPHCHPFPGSIPPGPKRPPFLSFFLSFLRNFWYIFFLCVLKKKKKKKKKKKMMMMKRRAWGKWGRGERKRRRKIYFKKKEKKSTRANNRWPLVSLFKRLIGANRKHLTKEL